MAERIFKKYTRPTLDAEYNNRAKVKEFEKFLAFYTNESKIARDELNCQLDISYGPNPRQKADFFSAAYPTKSAPVLLFFHGGYWKAFDKKDFSFVARGFVSQGISVLIVGYPLIPAVNMSELVRQCRQSIVWAWQNASSFGGSPDQLYVVGHSAGGHLASMMMATNWEEFGDLPTNAIKGGCGISGIYDLTPIALCYLDDELQLSHDEVLKNSPAYLAPQCPGRFIFAVGELEGSEFLRQSEKAALVWQKNGHPAEVMRTPGDHHFSIVTQLNDPAQKLTRAIYGLIKN